MQRLGEERRQVLSALRAARREDFSFARGEVLGSMCTAPHEIGLAAAERFQEVNLGDPGHFPGTARLEREVLADLQELLHAPPGSSGRFVSGGTEANLLACYLARERTGRRGIVVSEAAHFSFQKAARLLGMHLTVVPTVDHRADAAAMLAAATTETALVVAVAGTTELGLIDPVAELAAGCHARSLLLHVDAAYGGYLIPFLADASRVPRAFDFSLPGVTSLAIDPHKGGMSTMPAGVLILRDGADWQRTAVASPYLSTVTQSTLLGTRPGSAVAATWAIHRHLGLAGFASVAETCLDNATFLAARLVELGLELVAQPELSVVTFRVPEPKRVQESLRKSGWSVNVIPRFSALRTVTGPHVTRAHLARFVADLPRSLG